MVGRKSTRKAAGTRKERAANALDHKPSTPPALDVELVCGRLRTVLKTLQSSMSSTIVSIEALRRQDADADRDIALVLQQNVSDRLDVEIERISELVALIEVPALEAAQARESST